MFLITTNSCYKTGEGLGTSAGHDQVESVDDG